MPSPLPLTHLAILLNNIKHSSWAYENEFRCVMSTNSPGMPYIDAKAKELFVGLNCKPSHRKRLLGIGEKLGIPVHSMTFDELSSDYQLSVD